MKIKFSFNHFNRSFSLYFVGKLEHAKHALMRNLFFNKKKLIEFKKIGRLRKIKNNLPLKQI